MSGINLVGEKEPLPQIVTSELHDNNKAGFRGHRLKIWM